MVDSAPSLFLSVPNVTVPYVTTKPFRISAPTQRISGTLTIAYKGLIGTHTHTHSNSADKRYFDQTEVLTLKPTILETWELALPTLPARVVLGIGRIYAFIHP